MFGTLYIQNKTKNSAFKLYFGGISTLGSLRSNITEQDIRVSKDGGAWVATTNLLVEDNKTFYIQLTAEEMNVDNIRVRCDFKVDAVNMDVLIVIETTSPTGGGATAQEVWEYATREITGGGLSLTDTVTDITSLSDVNPTVREILSFMWMYFTKRRKRGWWSLYRHLFRG